MNLKLQFANGQATGRRGFCILTAHASALLCFLSMLRLDAKLKGMLHSHDNLPEFNVVSEELSSRTRRSLRAGIKDSSF